MEDQDPNEDETTTKDSTRVIPLSVSPRCIVLSLLTLALFALTSNSHTLVDFFLDRVVSFFSIC